MHRRGGALLLLLALVAGILPGGSNRLEVGAPAGGQATLPGVHALQAPLLPASSGTSLLAKLLSGGDLRSGPADGNLHRAMAPGLPPAGSVRTTPDHGAAGAGLSSRERLVRAGLLTAGATTVPPPHSD